jgi:hypothetical protein
MHRVAIPFSDPSSGARALDALLRAPRERGLAVELVAMVEPRRPGKVAVFVSTAEAERAAVAAAERWLAPLAARLAAAGIPHSTHVAVGAPTRTLRALAARGDLARIVVAPAAAPWQRWRGAQALAGARGPVTVVA